MERLSGCEHSSLLQHHISLPSFPASPQKREEHYPPTANTYKSTTWPIKTLTLDHLAANFLNRMRLDACSPQLTYNLSSNANATGRGTTIDSVTLSAASTVLQPACAGVRIPVTFPGPVKQVSSSSTTSTTTTEQVGSDPLTVWVTWMGVDVTFELQTGVSV